MCIFGFQERVVEGHERREEYKAEWSRFSDDEKREIITNETTKATVKKARKEKEARRRVTP